MARARALLASMTPPTQSPPQSPPPSSSSILQHDGGLRRREAVDVPKSLKSRVFEKQKQEQELSKDGLCRHTRDHDGRGRGDRGRGRGRGHGRVGGGGGALGYFSFGLGLALCVWSVFPYATVTVTFLVSCATLHAISELGLGLSPLPPPPLPPSTLLQPGAARPTATNRALSLLLSLCNTCIADVALCKFVRNSSEGYVAPLYDNILGLGGDGGDFRGHHDGQGQGWVLWPLLLPQAAASSVFALLYLYFAPLAVMVLQDAWFYHVHRALHAWPVAYRYIHALHHARSAPEGVDLFFMHPVEACVCVFLPLVALPYLVPMHWFTYEGWVVFSVLIDVYGHASHDIAPLHPFKLSPYAYLRGLFPWRKVFLMGPHHNLHHRRRRGNYALYFTFWDHMCGTELQH